MYYASDFEKNGGQHTLHIGFEGNNEHGNNNRHRTHQLKAKFELEISSPHISYQSYIA